MVNPSQLKYPYHPRLDKAQLSIMIEYALRRFETQILPWLVIPGKVLDTLVTVILLVITPFTVPYCHGLLAPYRYYK